MYIAKKYGIDAMRSKVVNAINKGWPKEVCRWDKVQEMHFERDVDALDLLRFGKDHGLSNIRAVALYQLSESISNPENMFLPSLYGMGEEDFQDLLHIIFLQRQIPGQLRNLSYECTEDVEHRDLVEAEIY